MKTLIIATLALASITVNAKSIEKSELQLRSCLVQAYSITTLSTKEINAKAKACRDSVREMKKQERITKKSIKLKERIAKLQKELADNK